MHLAAHSCVRVLVFACIPASAALHACAYDCAGSSECVRGCILSTRIACGSASKNIHPGSTVL